MDILYLHPPQIRQGRGDPGSDLPPLHSEDRGKSRLHQNQHRVNNPGHLQIRYH